MFVAAPAAPLGATGPPVFPAEPPPPID